MRGIRAVFFGEFSADKEREDKVPEADAHSALFLPINFSRFKVYPKKFIKVVMIAALKKSMNRLPTSGRIKKAIGEGP